jgi:succinyl-CoA synthetase beta subunit
MHIHEYQAKTLFNQFGIKTPEGVLISTVEQSSKACSELGGGTWVVKAQVHAGGRGKGGGVILCRSTFRSLFGKFSHNYALNCLHFQILYFYINKLRIHLYCVNDNK